MRQARSRLHSRAEAGVGVPLQGSVRVMALLRARSRVWVIPEAFCVCWASYTPCPGTFSPAA